MPSSPRWISSFALDRVGHSGLALSCMSEEDAIPEADDQKEEVDPLVVDAKPTKEFFIEMLVRDIELIPAVADLVDNSLDGARRLRAGERFDGLTVGLTVSPTEFAITDNCGGIDLETATKYAFRFGRPQGFGFLEHSIGQFGVGMKRALFKMGRKFKVESTSGRSRFVMTVEVEKWRGDPDNWTFRFDAEPEVYTEDVPEDERGTTITVTELLDAVSADFAEDQFLANLRSDLEQRHQLSVAKGLAISVNGDPLDPEPLVLSSTSDIKPAKLEMSVDSVDIALLCGIADSNGDAAGWSIFCNDRLILLADQSSVTGWGWREGSARIPKFHAQYARFRGYAFFEASDSRKLPWNTTKTSVDTDSAVFRQARRHMISLGRPVLNFLNQAADEVGITSVTGDTGPLQLAIASADASKVAFDRAEIAEVFAAPSPELTAPAPTTSAIHYNKPIAQIEQMKELLGATSNKEVGERTFDDFYFRAFEDDVP